MDVVGRERDEPGECRHGGDERQHLRPPSAEAEGGERQQEGRGAELRAQVGKAVEGARLPAEEAGGDQRRQHEGRQRHPGAEALAEATLRCALGSSGGAGRSIGAHAHRSYWKAVSKNERSLREWIRSDGSSDISSIARMPIRRCWATWRL